MEEMHEKMRQLESRLQAQSYRQSSKQLDLAAAKHAVDILAASNDAVHDSSLDTALQVKRGR